MKDSKIPQTIKTVMTMTVVRNLLFRVWVCIAFSPDFISVLYYGICFGTAFLECSYVKMETVFGRCENA